MPLTVALHKHHLIAIRIADYDDADVLPRMTDLAFSAGFLELIDLVIESASTLICFTSYGHLVINGRINCRLLCALTLVEFF